MAKSDKSEAAVAAAAHWLGMISVYVWRFVCLCIHRSSCVATAVNWLGMISMYV